MGFSDIARKYLGVKEGTTAHHAIIDGYNKIRPLPRGYKAKYNDSWCAIFVSFIMKQFKCVNPPYECGANQMLNLCKKNKQFTKKPHVNDLIFYDWNKSGTADHVGIISHVYNNSITTVEGNFHDSVGQRTISAKSRYILGYASIKIEVAKKTATEEIARAVIRGKYGNGKERKQRLEADGYNYNEVQKIVNRLLK